jgi:hypothetical protein
MVVTIAKGYTSAQLVAQELGLDLTAPQLDQCADLVAQVEDWIDNETGRSWSVTSPTIDELHPITMSPLVYLFNKPVLAVTSVKARVVLVGGQDVTLSSATDYELIDPVHGILLVNGFLGATGDIVTSPVLPGALLPNSLLKVTYTSATPPPGDIQRVATLMVAHSMSARLNPDRHGIESYSVGGDLQVKLRTDDLPAEVLRILRSREAVIFA